MKRNRLDKTVLALLGVCLGMIAVNHYVYQPIWKSEAKSELRALKQELRKERSEVKEAAKAVKGRAKDAAASSKIRLKEAFD